MSALEAVPETKAVLISLLTDAANAGILDDDAGDLTREMALLVRLIKGRLEVRREEQEVSLPPGHERLSTRERTVLVLMGQGFTNKQIARELRIAPETVKSFAKRIFMKLGATSRAQSVAMAARLDLL